MGKDRQSIEAGTLLQLLPYALISIYESGHHAWEVRS